MVVGVLGMQVRKTLAKPDTRPLWQNFYIFGCEGNSSVTISPKLDISELATRAELFELSSIPKLVDLSPFPCQLEPNTLYQVYTKSQDKLWVSLVFTKLLSEEKSESKGNIINHNKTRNAEEGGEGAQRRRKDRIAERNENVIASKDNIKHVHQEEKVVNNVTCNFSTQRLLSLKSGYGFVSCQGPEASAEPWKTWQTGIQGAEENVAHSKKSYLIAVLVGTLLVVLLIVMCVVCRLRSSRSPQYDPRRRPSNISRRPSHTSGTVLQSRSTQEHSAVHFSPLGSKNESS